MLPLAIDWAHYLLSPKEGKKAILILKISSSFFYQWEGPLADQCAIDCQAVEVPPDVDITSAGSDGKISVDHQGIERPPDRDGTVAGQRHVAADREASRDVTTDTDLRRIGDAQALSNADCSRNVLAHGELTSRVENQ